MTDNFEETDSEKIERYILGLSKPDEIDWVESLFLDGEDNQTLKYLIKKDWDKILVDTSEPGFDITHIIDKVHHIIRKNETMQRKIPVQVFKRIYMKAAAILFIPMLVAGGVAYSYLGFHSESSVDKQLTSNSIYAPIGARVSFVLPDNSKGMLNSGSRLTYSLPFINNRQVKLEGEAWLEVSHDENHLFEISTGNSKISVLGTRLNISAYPAENYVEVVLQKGKVEFIENQSDKKMTLLPSERLIFQSGNMSKSFIDTVKYTAWTEGKLVFRGDPMAEVARRIERWYNVKVILADKELEKYSFRATFTDDNLVEVLRILCLTSPISYRIISPRLLTDGTIEKEKVYIYLKK